MQQKKQLLKIKDIDSVLKDITLNANISESEKRQYAEKILAGPFMDLRSDWAFKYFFSIKENLIKFINDVLPVSITDLEYLPNEIPVRSEKDKRSVLDVRCKSGSDQFLVEMQRLDESDMDDRILYYGSTMLHNQVKRGDEEYLLQPVYVLCVADYDIKHNEPVPDGKFLFHYHNLEQEIQEPFDGDKIHFFFLELPRMKKIWQRTETNAERWSYLIENLSTFVKPLTGNLFGFDSILDNARIDTLSGEEQKEYVQDMVTKHYIRVTSEAAYNRGVEDRNIEIARQMLAKNYPPEDVAEITGLSTKELSEISQS